MLKAMVPVSVRADAERGALGNQVAAMWAPLPVGIEDPDRVHRLRRSRLAMDDLKHSGQAVGAEVLTNLAGFAPPTILSQAARLQARQQFFNLVVTNVPGPQFPLYLLGRRLQRRSYPVVPLAATPGAGDRRDGELRRGHLSASEPARRLRRAARSSTTDRARAGSGRSRRCTRTAAGLRPGARSREAGPKPARGRSPPAASRRRIKRARRRQARFPAQKRQQQGEDHGCASRARSCPPPITKRFAGSSGSPDLVARARRRHRASTCAFWPCAR